MAMFQVSRNSGTLGHSWRVGGTKKNKKKFNMMEKENKKKKKTKSKKQKKNKIKKTFFFRWCRE